MIICVVNLLMLQLRVFLSQMSHLRALWGRILAEILRNTQNFGRNSEEKIGQRAMEPLICPETNEPIRGFSDIIWFLDPVKNVLL